jgi:hypothetical protein
MVNNYRNKPKVGKKVEFDGLLTNTSNNVTNITDSTLKLFTNLSFKPRNVIIRN